MKNLEEEAFDLDLKVKGSQMIYNDDNNSEVSMAQ